jgi:hypothetical protein
MNQSRRHSTPTEYRTLLFKPEHVIFWGIIQLSSFKSIPIKYILFVNYLSDSHNRIKENIDDKKISGTHVKF